MAAEEVTAGPQPLTMTRYCFPLSASVVAAVVKLDEVAPLMLAKFTPPSVLSCHWNVPLAVTENVAVDPLHTVWFAGCVEMDGADPTAKLPVMLTGSAIVPSEE